MYPLIELDHRLRGQDTQLFLLFKQQVIYLLLSWDSEENKELIFSAMTVAGGATARFCDNVLPVHCLFLRPPRSIEGL